MTSRREWPIVVGGCHRSGTSLVRRLLDAHSHIYCGPEVKFFRDFYEDYRDDPLGHLRFSRTARDLLGEDELLAVLGRAFVELHERAAHHAGKARWADKAPENVLYLEQWGRLLGDCWVLVHVVRDPLDTITSMRGRFPLTLPTDLDGQIAFYRRYTEAGLVFGERHPDRYVLVVYEELCTQPRETLARMMKALNEELQASQLAFNRSPHAGGLEDPNVAATDEVHAGRIGAWRSILSEDEAALIRTQTQDLWMRICPSE